MNFYNDDKKSSEDGHSRRTNYGRRRTVGEKSSHRDFKHSAQRRPFAERRKRAEEQESQNQAAESLNRSPEESEQSTASELLCGRNPVSEALAAGTAINKAWILKATAESGRDRRLLDLEKKLREAGVPVLTVDRRTLDKMAGEARHQGIIAQIAAREYANSGELIDAWLAAGKDPFILILDGLQDGRNLGAALRIAECCGVDLVVLPERRSVSLDAYVARAAAGALEYVPVAREVNLSRFVMEIKKKGFWIFGTAAEAENDFKACDYRGKTALIIGSEGEGIAEKLRTHCDLLLRIPMWGQLNSLNASVACGIVCFEAARQRHEAPPVES